jgi:hypothetical protein
VSASKRSTRAMLRRDADVLMRWDGDAVTRFWALSPISALGPSGNDGHMRTADPIGARASELLAAARRLQAAAEEPGCHLAAPDALASLEETLQVLSAAWYRLAADAAPGIADRPRREPARGPSRATRTGLSRELEVQLVDTLHDVAAGFARCARVCRAGRSTVTPIIAGGIAVSRPTSGGEGRPRPEDSRDLRQRVA